MQDLPPIPKVWEPTAELRWLRRGLPGSLAPHKLQQRWVEIGFHTINAGPSGLTQLIKQPTGAFEWRNVPAVMEEEA